MTKNIKHEQHANLEGFDLDVKKIKKSLENMLNTFVMHIQLYNALY